MPTSSFRLIGTDRTMERGPVNVYLGADGMAYVAAVDAGRDTRGNPMGLRMAPSGTEAAAALHCKKHRLHSLFAGKDYRGSPDFKPVRRQRKARVA
jgi:hypothetical protein